MYNHDCFKNVAVEKYEIKTKLSFVELFYGYANWNAFDHNESNIKIEQLTT